jgi:hypothetical protein
MTSEELNFGTERVGFSTIARLVSVTFVACVIFVGGMYYIGKSNTPVASNNQTASVQLH